VPKASERLTRAVELVDVRASDRVLELGCGHGVAVSLVCERLDGGTVTAIDRSATMTAATRKRNAAWVEMGAAIVRTGSLHEIDFDGARFDKVFGVHFPPLLRGDPRRELEVVRDVLAPGGTLHVVFQPFTVDQVDATVEHVTARLEANGFRVSAVVTAPGAPAPVVDVVSG
jgi:SAM-dependent methyltransferase